MTSKNPRGFTLLEVLVSLVIFNIAALGIAQSFLVHMQRNTQYERRGEAVQAAQQVLDEIRVLDPVSMPTSGTTTQDLVFGPRTYAVSTTYCETSSLCSSPNVRQITVAVELDDEELYSVETIYAQLR